MHDGVSLTAVKGTTSCFQEVLVMLACLKEFYPQLMLDDIKDLVNQSFRG